MLRTANKHWFQYVKIDEFSIYFATLKKIPDIIEHFATLYEDIPIGISLLKIVTNKLGEFPLEPFGRLTHLTSFNSFPLAFRSDSTALLALTNLQSFIPIGKWSPATNLTFLVTTEPYVQLPFCTRLHDLHISLPGGDLNPFTLVANPSLLKRLTVRVKRLEWSEDDPNTVAQFTNLKELTVVQFENNMTRFARYLTSLEKLNLFYRAALHEDDICSLTQLTYLSMDEYHNISTLYNLKYLRMAVNSKYEKDYSFLSILTNLEGLQSSRPIEECLQYLNSRKITSLEFSDMHGVSNVDYLLKLSSLLSLKAHEVLVRNISENYEAIIGLNKLTNLEFEMQNATLVQYTVLNELTNLKRLILEDRNRDMTWQMHGSVTLVNLPNLEELCLQCVPSQTLYDEFSRLTRLTSLKFALTAEVLNSNPTVLRNLPLRVLTFYKQIISPHVWDLVTRLTQLEELNVWRVPSEGVVASFSVLANLTFLNVQRTRGVFGIHLTKLTSLQKFLFISKPAKKFYEKKFDYLVEKLTRLQEKRFAMY
jgi:hypothetical protein